MTIKEEIQAKQLEVEVKDEENLIATAVNELTKSNVKSIK